MDKRQLPYDRLYDDSKSNEPFSNGSVWLVGEERGTKRRKSHNLDKPETLDDYRVTLWEVHQFGYTPFKMSKRNVAVAAAK